MPTSEFKTERRKNHATAKSCSCCQNAMPRDPEGHEVAVGWKLVRVEEHGAREIEIKHYLLCAGCCLKFSPKQTSLALPSPTTTPCPEISR